MRIKNGIIYENNLMVCTVKQLAKYLSSQIDGKNVLKNKFPNCDFAIIDTDTFDDLENLRCNSSGWYGIKAVDAGFDSCDLILISDYYGGSCAKICQIFDDMNEILPNDNIESNIKRIVLNTLQYQESANENTYLIVDFIN